MPTDEWLENNPKISAYIPKETDQALKDWMEANGIKKMSHALNKILSEYLGSAQTQSVAPIVSDDRLKTIEARLEEIESRLETPEVDEFHRQCTQHNKNILKQMRSIA